MPAAPAPKPTNAIAWRTALAVNALVAAAALAVKFHDAATASEPQLTSAFSRVADELCYFTIQSNLIVVAVCVLLAWRPERWRAVAGAPRLVALVCITVTGAVYYALLAADQHLVGLAAVADVLAHAVSPILFVGTWLFLGPRGHLRARHIAALLLFVAAWTTLTLVRGAITGIYPYDFVDVGANGGAPVAATLVALTAAAVGLAVAFVRVDGRLASRAGSRRDEAVVDHAAGRGDDRLLRGAWRPAEH